MRRGHVCVLDVGEEGAQGGFSKTGLWIAFQDNSYV